MAVPLLGVRIKLVWFDNGASDGSPSFRAVRAKRGCTGTKTITYRGEESLRTKYRACREADRYLN